MCQKILKKALQDFLRGGDYFAAPQRFVNG